MTPTHDSSGRRVQVEPDVGVGAPPHQPVSEAGRDRARPDARWRRPKKQATTAGSGQPARKPATHSKPPQEVSTIAPTIIPAIAMPTGRRDQGIAARCSPEDFAVTHADAGGVPEGDAAMRVRTFVRRLQRGTAYVLRNAGPRPPAGVLARALRRIAHPREHNRLHAHAGRRRDDGNHRRTHSSRKHR